MFKRPREFPIDKPIPKKAKYDHEEMMCDDAQPTQTALLHAFHVPAQMNHSDLLSQMCAEQYEEIQYIQQHWTPDSWARVGDCFKQKIEALTDIASSFTEFQERERLLNQINENIVYSAIYFGNTLLALENKKLTRFPVSVLNDPRLIEYWSQLRSLFLGQNRLRYIPAELAKLQSLQCLQLHRNQLKTIPVELSKLPNLTLLSLSHNHLNRLPIEFSTIRLQNIYVSNNHLSEKQLAPFVPQLGSAWLQHTSSTQTPPTQTLRLRR